MAKKNIKVRDLKPSKDAKGGGPAKPQGVGVNHGGGGPAINTGGKSPSHHGHHNVN